MFVSVDALRQLRFDPVAGALEPIPIQLQDSNTHTHVNYLYLHLHMYIGQLDCCTNAGCVPWLLTFSYGRLAFPGQIIRQGGA